MRENPQKKGRGTDHFRAQIPQASLTRSTLATRVGLMAVLSDRAIAVVRNSRFLLWEYTRPPPLRRSKVTSRQIAQKAPYPVDVEAGKTYYWCACGQSKKQPFCDGSHKTTDIVPVAWTAEKTSTSYFCGCKHSKTEPLCDGSHAKL